MIIGLYIVQLELNLGDLGTRYVTLGLVFLLKKRKRMLPYRKGQFNCHIPFESLNTGIVKAGFHSFSFKLGIVTISKGPFASGSKL